MWRVAGAPKKNPEISHDGDCCRLIRRFGEKDGVGTSTCDSAEACRAAWHTIR